MIGSKNCPRDVLMPSRETRRDLINPFLEEPLQLGTPRGHGLS